MFNEDLFLNEDECKLKLIEYVQTHSDIKVKNNKLEVSVYQLPMDTGISPILSEKYITLTLQELPNKQGYFNLQVTGKGFPRIKSTNKARTLEEMNAYINIYFEDNMLEIKDILQ